MLLSVEGLFSLLTPSLRPVLFSPFSIPIPILHLILTISRCLVTFGLLLRSDLLLLADIVEVVTEYGYVVKRKRGDCA